MRTKVVGSLAVLLLGGAALGMEATAGAQTVFNYTGAVTTYTVAQSGLYEITAIGADGGPARGGTGGSGVKFDGDVFLTSGTIYQVVVGGTGKTGDIPGQYGGGGGGGSFVFISGAANPLAVAGGGGGAGFFFTNGSDGQTGTSGQAGQDTNSGAGGTNGTGGGGYLGNVSNGAGSLIVSGSGGFGPTTFAGGAGASSGTPPPDGGFGGGGGGYSGGGGGGGSFFGPAFSLKTFGTNGLGNGSVTFTQLTTSTTPNPAVWPFSSVWASAEQACWRVVARPPVKKQQKNKFPTGRAHQVAAPARNWNLFFYASSHSPSLVLGRRG